MPQKIRVFLVRHGQSAANIDWTVNQRLADHAIPLTEEGHKQAEAAGKFLASYFKVRFLDDPKRAGQEIIRVPRIRGWRSPYKRTRQTAEGLFQACKLQESAVIEGFEGSDNPGILGRATGESWFYDEKIMESVIMHEQLFGLFDGMSDEEREDQFPVEWAHYQKCKAQEGKVWAKMPNGESRMDVAIRLHHGFGTFHRDADRHGIRNIVIVGHGTVNRAFTMMWCHHPWEFLEKEPNPNNCSIRMLENGEDMGYIFDGFPPKGDDDTVQPERRDGT